ncbi:VCBS repeat-containing protein [Castellaniella sp.]|uniref:FG-GAP repeat domain-containing protein n=1 Tax=Castellaniella sp. TaxID=1955812 RepID=UPI002AFEDA92|nr:VCBS repeat-containing protein [Castellaniella sp.]
MTFITQTFKGLYGSSVLSYGVGDFNGDGIPEFIYNGPVTPFQNKKQGFELISIDANGNILDASSILSIIPTAIHAREMFIGDLNKDGIDDFYSANHGYDAPPFPGEPNTLMLSSGGQLVNNSAHVPRSAFSHSVTGGDIDNDGDIDLFIGVLGRNWSGDFGPYFLINDGTGQFTTNDNIVPASINGMTEAGRFTASLLTDINNDGWLDLVLGSEEHGVTAGITYLNNQHGGFDQSSQALLPTGRFGSYDTITSDIVTMDVTGDGYVDLILAQTDGHPFYQGQQLQILINDGTGRFIDETDSRIQQDGIGQWSQNIQAIDFNNDGYLDILSQSDFSTPTQQNVLWLNKGDGTFSPLPARMLEGFAGGIVPLDFNHDGRLDYLSISQKWGASEAEGLQINTHLNVAGSLLFDDAMYYVCNPDVAAADVDAYLHYQAYGWKEGRNPNRYFDSDDYLAKNPDVAAADINPLDHYVTYGWKEGRNPNAGFDTNAYLNAYTDVALAGINPLDHFLTLGMIEGRSAFAVDI